MASSIYAQDMAKALFEAAQKKGELIKWLGELRLANDLLKDEALAQLVKNKDLSVKDKTKALNERGIKLSDEMLNMISLLLEKGKMAELESIAVDYQKLIDERSQFVKNDVSDAIANSASRIAKTIQATCIVCLTSSGSTARRISKYRPQVPIYSMTNNAHIISVSELMWGVTPYLIPLTEDVQESIDLAIQFLKERHMVAQGNRVVFTLGIPMGVSGSTNLIQVVHIK